MPEARPANIPRPSPFTNLLDLAKTLQFAWFSGHVVVLLTSLFYFVSFRSKSQFHNGLYRLTYLGVLESFSIIIYQQHFKAKNQTLSIKALAQDENVMYFAIALLWLLTPRFTLTMIPFIIFSTFHFLTYMKSVLLPQVLQWNDENRYVALITKFIRENNDKSMVWSGSAELLCLIAVIFRALLWYPKSWLVLIIYSTFIKVRYEKSAYMRNCVKKWEVRADGIVSSPSLPSSLKSGYVKFKETIKQLNKYKLLGGSTVPEKKQ